MALTFSVPEVRARWINELVRAFQVLAAAVAARAGRPADDIQVRAFVGAVLGVMLVAMEPLIEDPTREWTEFLPDIDGRSPTWSRASLSDPTRPAAGSPQRVGLRPARDHAHPPPASAPATPVSPEP